jgi:hypothetical protein
MARGWSMIFATSSSLSSAEIWLSLAMVYTPEVEWMWIIALAPAPEKGTDGAAAPDSPPGNRRLLLPDAARDSGLERGASPFKLK